LKLFGPKYRNLHDEELMPLVVNKDRRAFEELYDRYAKLMYNYFLRMLWKDREKSRDMTQDLFTRIAAKPHLYDASRPFKTWIYTIAHNMCKNEYAKHEVRAAARSELMYTSNSTTHEEATGKMDRTAFMESLMDALDRLDDIKRQTFELRFFQELSIIEISEIMEISEGTVKSRLFYILKELNKELKSFENILNL
jgi:RNA polymerase sigma-70 factor (ECF subfamily)